MTTLDVIIIFLIGCCVVFAISLIWVLASNMRDLRKATAEIKGKVKE